MADFDDVESYQHMRGVQSPPIQPLSPYEQYNVTAGQRKDPGPMRQWGIKDMTTGK